MSQSMNTVGKTGSNGSDDRTRFEKYFIENPDVELRTPEDYRKASVSYLHQARTWHGLKDSELVREGVIDERWRASQAEKYVRLARQWQHAAIQLRHKMEA